MPYEKLSLGLFDILIIYYLHTDINIDSHVHFSCRDAKIAALEKTSQDAEKLIAEARSEKMRHMDELHVAQKKVADFESR